MMIEKQQGQTQELRLLRFWRAVEACVPQKVEKTNPSDTTEPVYKLSVSDPLPWFNLKHRSKQVAPAHVWRYTLQAGLYDIEKFSILLEDKLGVHGDVFDERRPIGQARLFDLVIDEDGYPLAQSFVLSLACWAAGQILHYPNGIAVLEDGGTIITDGLPEADEDIPSPYSGYEGFDMLVRRLIQWITDEVAEARNKETPFRRAWFDALTGRISDLCLLPAGLVASTYVAKCSQVKKPEPKPGKAAPQTAPSLDVDLLNSFFVNDLNKLCRAWANRDVGKGLTEYVQAVMRQDPVRQDVRTAEGVAAAIAALDPARFPEGSWPSEHPLAFSQQLAVNELWSQLEAAPGIFAINGPPGTGKTTLLRDVVAAVVTARAASLVRVGGQAFSSRATKKIGGFWCSYQALHPDLAGFSIIVASANNGAVGNISLELPGINAVPTDVPERVAYQDAYYKSLATNVLNKPAWGLLAARMGSKLNRTRFMNKFWWKEPVGVRAKKDRKHAQDDTAEEVALRAKQDCVPFVLGGEGLRYHLIRIQEGKREPAIGWKEAVARFQQAQEGERQCRDALLASAKLNADAAQARARVEELAHAVQSIQASLSTGLAGLLTLQARVEGLDAQLAGVLKRRTAAQTELAGHDKAKPGLLVWLSTAGRSHREWWIRRQEIDAQVRRASTDYDTVATEYEDAKAAHVTANRGIAEQKVALNQKRADHQQALNQVEVQSQACQLAMRELGTAWPQTNGNDEERELSAPWSMPEWRRARQDLFLAALDVHRAFIEAHPQQIIDNLNLASGWLQGTSMPEEMARTALDSLALVVPVISTTFASVPRMFRQLGCESIGWLLIDEAGQALPEQAAGAIWRAERTVVVGDPNQLEPVLGLPVAVEGALAQHYDVPRNWWPSATSAQRLSDQSMSMGTWLPGMENEKVWVGSPLRVHRRCDDPMFSISNDIAYDGLMVHGKPPTECAWPDPHWIDVRAQTGEGNWIPQEGVAARRLVQRLRAEHDVELKDIFLISPFKDTAKQLRAMAKELGLDPTKTDTVHTTQGKEAAAVILVLGGNPQREGAKDWAAKSPNLLNVAVSRAKARLYVIGDRAAWSKRPYFRVLSNWLPGTEESVEDKQRESSGNLPD